MAGLPSSTAPLSRKGIHISVGDESAPMTSSSARDRVAVGRRVEIAGSRTVGTLGETELRQALWPHQEAALGAFERDLANGDAATYLVVRLVAGRR